MVLSSRNAVAASMFFMSFALVLFELALTRIFGVVLFASFAHLALALALLGISAGALAQHLWPWLVPETGLRKRLAQLALAQAGTTLLAVTAAASLPVTKQWKKPAAHYAERSAIVFDLVDPLWFSVLLPVLCVPFVVAGLAFAGAFLRKKEDIGFIYGADLIGGAFGALLFVPLLYAMSGPDTVFVVALAGCASAGLLFTSAAGKVDKAARVSWGLAGVALVLSIVAGTGVEIHKIRFSAGYDERNVTYTRWTPLTRLALHEDERGTYMLLDNSSASEVILTAERRAKKATEPNRGVVYQLHQGEPSRIAILAASAGPEVAVAQHFGHSNIDAIDIAPEIGDVVAEKFPDSPVNPFLQPNTRRVLLDGRAAILHAEQPYDIIQMVHANLHSSAGLLSSAWSPSLLETKEAFATYLDKLTPDGTISFGRGPRTDYLARSAAEALLDLGVTEPERHILYITGNATVMLVKKRPWTPAERDRVQAAIAKRKTQKILLDPINPDPGVVKQVLWRRHIMTDDRPYMDSPDKAVANFMGAGRRLFSGLQDEVAPIVVIYQTLAIQILFVLLAGLALVIVPALRRAPTGLVGIKRVGWGLLYVSCLGYGYLAVETVLIHELVLFVGHPIYAITVVILTMLLFSGIGSMVVQRIPQGRLDPMLRLTLAIVVVLGAFQAYVVPELLHDYALGLGLGMRAFLVGLVLMPLGFVMGMPFPFAMRLLRPEAAGMVPWAWALNGWMSVVASLGTVVFSRIYGYSWAFGIALLAYVGATLLSPVLSTIGTDAEAPTKAGG